MMLGLLSLSGKGSVRTGKTENNRRGTKVSTHTLQYIYHNYSWEFSELEHKRLLGGVMAHKSTLKEHRGKVQRTWGWEIKNKSLQVGKIKHLIKRGWT